MATRRGVIGGMVSAAVGAVGIGVVVGGISHLSGQDPPSEEAAEAAKAVVALAKKAEGALDVIYGLALVGAVARGKKVGGAILALEGVASMAEGAGKMGKDAPAASPPVPTTPPVETAAVDPNAGTTAQNPQAQDIVMAPAHAVTEGVTATLEFVRPPVLPGREGQPSASLYVTPVAWDQEGRPHYGQPFLIEAVELNAPFSLYAPGLQQPDVPGPGVYQLGYRLWETDEGPDLTGGGPILHVLADEDWAYEAILAQADTEPRPETVYSQTYAFAPEAESAAEG